MDPIDSQSSSAALPDDAYHKEVIAKAAKLAPHAHTPVLVKSTGSKRKVFEAVYYNANRASLQVEREVVDVTSNKYFHILLTNVSNKPVYVPKRVLAAHVTDSPAPVIAIRGALYGTVVRIIGAVHHKRSIDRVTQVKHQRCGSRK